MAIHKKVVRSDTWTNPVFDEMLRATPGVELEVIRISGADDESWSALEQASVYHLMAAKDEIPRQWQVTEELLRRCPDLMCVSSSGAGYDTIDVEACTKAGVAVVNQAGGNAVSVAEQTIGLMIAVSRRICEQDRKLHTQRGYSREDVMGHEIGGRVLGLVGVGHIGTRVAALARAFGMTVLGTDPYLDSEEIASRGAIPVSMDELLERSDFFSLHCPRTRETTNLINAQALKKMKRGAVFVSTARGGIHDEMALFEALSSGHLSGAGLDVWSVEPPPLDHPLLKLDNVVATFHTAGVSHECRYNVAKIAAEQIQAFLNGGRPPRLVNPDAWPAVRRRLEAANLF